MDGVIDGVEDTELVEELRRRRLQGGDPGKVDVDSLLTGIFLLLVRELLGWFGESVGLGAGEFSCVSASDSHL